ncbi:MAG TPA: DinB family protein [Roseiflexaceae bacterium]|nr:DinB family protein [Roseiflexaceae bacterium]
MSVSPAMAIIDAYCATHRRMLALAERMNDEQISWCPTPDSHTIAFHLWHTARWADHLQAAIPGMTVELGRLLGNRAQIWQAQELAVAWRFPGDSLGFDAPGMHMPDELARSLPFPAHATLLEYARQAFDAAEQAVRTIDDEQFVADEAPQPLTAGIWQQGSRVGDAILAHMVHASRHLGAVEALYGCQVGSGTASV